MVSYGTDHLRQNVIQVLKQNTLTGVQRINDTKWICSLCHSTIKEGKLPSCAKVSKMTLPEKPEALNLTERLVSPRIPCGGQLSIHGIMLFNIMYQPILIRQLMFYQDQ